MSDSRAVFHNRQDKRGRSVWVVNPPNLLTSTLAPVVAATPFVSEQTGSSPFRRLSRNLDTSRGTPKVLFEDVSFAPGQSEWPTTPRRKHLTWNGSWRNIPLLSTPAAGNPFTSTEAAERVARPRILPDTSKSVPKTLFGDAVQAFKNPQANRPSPQKIGTETSYRNSALLGTAPPPPFVVPPTLLTPQYVPSRDTSQSSPLALLDFDPGDPMFTRWGWPAPIEYRHLILRSWDPQAFPENIPPAPPPPAPRVDLGGATPRKKDAKREREELLDEVIGEVLKPASPSPLPKPLKPLLEARPVVVPAPGPLSVPPVLEPPDDTEEIIRGLLASGLF